MSSLHCPAPNTLPCAVIATVTRAPDDADGSEQVIPREAVTRSPPGLIQANGLPADPPKTDLETPDCRNCRLRMALS